MAAKKSESFTGLRSWRTNVLTLPAFPMLRVGVGKAPMFDSQKRIPAHLHAPDGSPVVRRYIVEATGEVLTDGECIKKYEAEGGIEVELTEAELDRIKSEGDKDVELVALMSEDALHPEFYKQTHDLWPLTRADADGYKLIETMLRKDGRALVGTVIEDGTTKTMVVRYSPVRECLVSHVLDYERNLRLAQSETVRDRMEAIAEPTDEMMGLATTIFGSLPTDFDFGSVDDEFAARLEAAVAAKAAGQEVPETVAGEAPAEVHDLMAALKASVAVAEARKESESVEVSEVVPA